MARRPGYPLIQTRGSRAGGTARSTAPGGGPTTRRIVPGEMPWWGPGEGPPNKKPPYSRDPNREILDWARERFPNIPGPGKGKINRGFEQMDPSDVPMVLEDLTDRWGSPWSFPTDKQEAWLGGEVEDMLGGGTLNPRAQEILENFRDETYGPNLPGGGGGTSESTMPPTTMAQMASGNLARNIASKGRMGDTEAAHLTKGEVVLPREVADNMQRQLKDMLGDAGLERFTVGSGENRINPETGLPEFWSPWKSVTKRIKKAAKKVKRTVKKVIPKEITNRLSKLEKLFPKEFRRISSLERTLEKSIGKMGSGFESVWDQFSDFDQIKKIIPKEIRRINELEKMYKDLEEGAGKFLQKGIDYTPGLGGFGLFASRQQVQSAQEEQAAASRQAREQMQAGFEESMEKQKKNFDAMMLASEQKALDIKAETDAMIMEEKVQLAQTKRELKEQTVQEMSGKISAGGEIGTFAAGTYTGPRYGGRRRRRSMVTAASLPGATAFGRPA